MGGIDEGILKMIEIREIGSEFEVRISEKIRKKKLKGEKVGKVINKKEMKEEMKGNEIERILIVEGGEKRIIGERIELRRILRGLKRIGMEKIKIVINGKEREMRRKLREERKEEGWKKVCNLRKLRKECEGWGMIEEKSGIKKIMKRIKGGEIGWEEKVDEGKRKREKELRI